MKHTTAWITAFTLGSALFGSAQAETLYRYRAADGSIMFTDEPVNGASRVEVQAPMVMPAVPVPGRAAPRGDAEEVFWPEPGATRRPRGHRAPTRAAGQVGDTRWNSATQGVSAVPRKASRALATEALSESASASYASLRPAPAPLERVTMSEKMEPRRRQRPASSPYDLVRVVSPSAGSARWVGGELSVFLATHPPLDRAHLISLQLDGREVARSDQLVTSIPNVARGTHALEAVIVDARSGERVDGSDQVIFQIHRPSALRSQRLLHPSIAAAD